MATGLFRCGLTPPARRDLQTSRRSAALLVHVFQLQREQPDLSITGNMDHAEGQCHWCVWQLHLGSPAISVQDLVVRNGPNIIGP